MNTNYSKIALLLALGAIAGDKVGADIRVNHVDGVQFNSDLRKSVVKGQFLDVLNKIHDTSKSKKLSEYLDRIQATIVSKNNVAVRSSDFIKGDDFKLTPEGRVVFGVDEGVFAPLLKDQKAKKELELDIKDDFKKLSEDIDHIVEQSKGTTAFDSSKLKVIKIDNSLKKDIEDFVARSSKSRISELFKGGVFVKDKLENIQYRTLHSDNIARLLSKEQNKLSQKINQLVGDISVASSDSGNPRVNVKAALVSLNNGIHDWTAGLSKSLLDAGDAKQSDLDDLSRAGKRLGLAAQFLAGMNVNGINKKAGATLLARACDSTKGTETDRTDLETALKASASSSDEHSTALATYLSKITGETVGGLVNPINNVLYYGNGNTAKTANANRVILGELGSAFGVTPPTMSKFDTNSASSDDEIKPVMDVFKPLEDLRKSLGGVKSKTAKSLTSYDIIKQNSQGRDVGFTLSYPSWNLNKKDDVSIEQIILYFEDVAKRIADLKNTSADAFKTVSGDWAKTLTSTYNIVDSFIQQESRGLIGTFVADDTKGIIAGMVRDTIDQAQIKIKAAYGAAIEALGTTPVAPAGAEATQEQIDAAKKAEAAKLAADKLAAVKTVEALEALEIFKKGGLKIGDLSQDIKDLIKGEKDQTKAQTLFTKILKGFADKNSASIALKALFNPEIKDNLKVEDETPDSAVEMIVSNQTGKKQNASTGKNSGEQGEQKGQIKPNTNPDDDPEVDDEKVTLKTFELSGLLNLDTGKLAEDSDEEVKSFNKLLADAMKSLKGKKKSVPPKTRKNKADSIIKELVARFKEDYSGDNPEDAEEEEEKKAANVAKNNAVTAATTLITEKVYKAFGIKKAPAGKGKKAPVKRGAVKGGRGNVVKRGPRNKSQKQGNKKK